MDWTNSYSIFSLVLVHFRCVVLCCSADPYALNHDNWGEARELDWPQANVIM